MSDDVNHTTRRRPDASADLPGPHDGRLRRSKAHVVHDLTRHHRPRTGSLGIRGFNLGIDFKGGSSWEVLAPHATIAAMTSAVEKAGLRDPGVEKLGSQTYQVTADINNLSDDRADHPHQQGRQRHGQEAGKSFTQVSVEHRWADLGWSDHRTARSRR